MRIHHLNCVSGCPLGGFAMDGRRIASVRGRLTSHCLLLETAGGLVLVDTGYGLNDVASPRSRLSPFFRALVKPELREEMTAIRQIEALGFDPLDVRTIVLSHLDFDHAGGLDDFPWASVHLAGGEVAAAREQRTLLDRMRYRPQQWSTSASWVAHPLDGGERWLGFDGVSEIAGPEVLLVPLVGHTLGHCGVAVRRAEGWLLYAADAYFYHAEMNEKPRCTPGLRAYQRLMEKDRRKRLANQRRLRHLRQEHGDGIEIFCAHDVREFERLARRSHRTPAGMGSIVTAATPARAASAHFI